MTLTTSTELDRTWSSGLTFVLAAVGAAVGLGNIWKFPYVVGVSGGGAFVLIYLACVVFVAIPILITELWIGRRGNRSPPVAMKIVATNAGRSTAWSVVGWMGMLVGYLIATYYSVIAGWTLAYIVKAGTGFGGALPAEVSAQFDTLLAERAQLRGDGLRTGRDQNLAIHGQPLVDLDNLGEQRRRLFNRQLEQTRTVLIADS